MSNAVSYLPYGIDAASFSAGAIFAVIVGLLLTVIVLWALNRRPARNLAVRCPNCYRQHPGQVCNVGRHVMDATLPGEDTHAFHRRGYPATRVVTVGDVQVPSGPAPAAATGNTRDEDHAQSARWEAAKESKPAPADARDWHRHVHANPDAQTRWNAFRQGQP